METLPPCDMATVHECLNLYECAISKADLPLEYTQLTSNGGGTSQKTYFFCARKGEDIYICIRGAKEPGDFVIVSDLDKVDLLGGKAHHGVLMCARWIIEQCEQFLAQSHKRVICTGHSLGGATAAVIATILRLERGMDNVFAYTFAAIPSMTRTLSSKGREFVFSFVYGNDIGPKMSSKNIAQLIDIIAPPGPQRSQGILSFQMMLMKMVEGVLSANGPLSQESIEILHQRMLPLLSSTLERVKSDEADELICPGFVYHITLYGENKDINVSKYNDNSGLRNVLLLMVGITDHNFSGYKDILMKMNSVDQII